MIRSMCTPLAWEYRSERVDNSLRSSPVVLRKDQSQISWNLENSKDEITNRENNIIICNLSAN